ncbi:hypothetical protein KKC13_08110 [bacterium]|nr:hypothetical protein [bacterium]MBU1957800.1 hypothetical protein [bacterium]
MLKPLLVILIIVSLIAIWLNFDLFDSTPNTVVTQSVDAQIASEPLTTTETQNITTPQKPITTNRDENLSKEIQALFKQASLLFQKNFDDKALELYDQIIQKIGNSTDTTRLQDFAKAYFQKGLIHQIYPNSDKDAAFEAYNMVIKKFEKSDNELLLKLYIEAKIKQAYLFDDDERIEIYDELVKQFENYKNNKFQTEVEELLFSQSYNLMGKDDEESMRILDRIISKYDKDENTKLPEKIETSILNTIELAIITNNDDTKYRELADKYLSESPDTKPLLGMLDIIRNAQDLEQNEALSKWKEDHADYRFPDWSFQELRAWMMKIEDKGTKERVSKYLDAFENHKYNVDPKKNKSQSHHDNSEIIYEPPIYNEPTDEPIQYENPYTHDANQEYQYETVYTAPDAY